MLRITNFAEAQAALLPYVPLVAQLTGKDTTLDRIRPLMELAGNPHEKLRVVHVAGTSGKTSTCYFVASLLLAARQKVGLTVSPHVDSIAERVQLNGLPLSETEFCEHLTEFLPIVERCELQPSYFELLYAFSLWVFARQQVDYAVVETGLGGLHDATNIITRPDKLCVITDIGYDHMQILGNTLEAIADQKAGIIHAHNQTLMYRQVPPVTAVLEAWAARQPAPLLLTTEAAERQAYGGQFELAMPAFQQRNWLLAYRAYRLLAKRDGLPSLNAEALAVTQHVQVPGRMDVRQVGDKLLVMDGAHNEQKMTTFLESFRRCYPAAKPAVLLALKEGKEVRDLGKLFAPLAARMIITSFKTSQDLPALAIDPQAVKTAFEADGVANAQVIPDQHQAYQALLAGAEPICIITGSFYLLSQLREREGLTA